jgi:hypothetical protein
MAKVKKKFQAAPTHLPAPVFLLTNRSTGFDRRHNIEYPKTDEK